MHTNLYLDFDLRFTKDSDGYRAEVVQSPGGVGERSFRLPFGDHELENYLLKIGQRRAGMRGLDSPETRAAREFGNKLYDALFQGDLAAAFEKSVEAAQTADRGLRIRLRLQETPELADLPWEYLYQSQRREFLALSKDTPVVRFFDLPGRVKPLAVTPPLRVLVMLSNPSDVDCLDIEKEWSKLKEAVHDLEARGLLIVERLRRATLTELLNRLRKEDYHVFHFVGHGGFDPATQESVLALENEQGTKALISGDDLGIYLRDEQTLRLVLLNACEGARASRSDPFSGAAQSLVLKGIPAVIAMQFEVSDEAAIAMASGFYSALADDYPVDAALTEARKAVFAAGCTVEWGTPVLYLRAEDARIFDVTKDAPSLPVPPPPPLPPAREEKRKAPKVDPPAPVVVPDSRKERAPRRWVWLLVGIIIAFGAFLALGLWINAHKTQPRPNGETSPTPAPAYTASPVANDKGKPDEPAPAEHDQFAKLRQAISALQSGETKEAAGPAGWSFQPVGSWVTYATPSPTYSSLTLRADGRFAGTSYDEAGNVAQLSGNWIYNAAASLLRINFDNGAWVQWPLRQQGELFHGSFQQNGVMLEIYMLKED